MARPDTIWPTRKVMVSTAWSKAVSPAATMAASSARTMDAVPRLWLWMAAHVAATAPMSIIPSTPRLSTPARSVTISPRAASRSGVP